MYLTILVMNFFFLGQLRGLICGDSANGWGGNCSVQKNYNIKLGEIMLIWYLLKYLCKAVTQKSTCNMWRIRINKIQQWDVVGNSKNMILVFIFKGNIKQMWEVSFPPKTALGRLIIKLYSSFWCLEFKDPVGVLEGVSVKS